jgi:atypical dual specificity phosphatase
MLPVPSHQSTITAMDYSQILPNLHVGSCPRSPEDIDRLKREAGVTAVVNLQTSGDFTYWDIDWPELEAYYRESGVVVRWLPIQDFNRDALREGLPKCVEVVDGLVKEDHTVYVHCNIGVNRSPSVVIAYLHWVEGRALDEAVDHVMRFRSCDPYVEAIRLATEDRAGAKGC